LKATVIQTHEKAHYYPTGRDLDESYQHHEDDIPIEIEAYNLNYELENSKSLIIKSSLADSARVLETRGYLKF